MNPLRDSAIVAELRRAWQESNADSPSSRHEEGGYVVQNLDSSLSVQRWNRGSQSRILPPPLDANNCYNGFRVIAAFHTHPNPPIDEFGQEWEQEPSAADRRWHRNRRLGGYVISQSLVYAIDASGAASIVGKRDEVFV